MVRWTICCDYSDAFNAYDTHWRCQRGLCSQGKAKSNSFRGLLQQGLCNGGRLSGGKKLVHRYENFCMKVCNDC